MGLPPAVPIYVISSDLDLISEVLARSRFFGGGIPVPIFIAILEASLNVSL